MWFLHRKEQRTPAPGDGAAPPAYDDQLVPDPTSGDTVDYTGGYATTYDPAYASGTAYPPAAPWGSYDRPRRPRNPRKRGPILFWFTLALIALAEGVLGVVDLAGVDVADSAYPALALGITALMLVVGSFWGRAGGLILAGPRRRPRHGRAQRPAATSTTRTGYYAPTSADEVAGDLRLRWRRASSSTCPTSRTSRPSTAATSSIDGFGGEVEVIVPDGMDVDVRTQVVGGQTPGLRPERRDGFDITVDGSLDGGDDVPDMSINIDLVAGEILVREAA